MSEASEKILGMNQLPLFPLQVVLLPSEILPLHIFEPRYRRMLADIELRRNVFGVAYIDEGGGITGRPAIGSIGCAAEIREKSILPDGRSNVVTSGLMRFRILDYAETDAPYLICTADFFEDDSEDPEAIKPLADEVYDLFERVARAAFKLSGSRGSFPEIPRTNPEKLSFLVAAAFNLDDEMKTRLAEMTSTTERLTKLRTILLQAVDKMEDNADIVKAAQTNGHSKKKVDF